MLRLDFAVLPLILGLTMAMLSFSLDTTMPSMPALAAELGGSVGTAQLALSIMLIGVALGQVAHGPLSDRFGRKPVLLANIALFIAVSVVSAFAQSLAVFMACRFLHGYAACSGHVVVRAIVRDRFERDNAVRMFAYAMFALSFAPIAAQVVGGVLAAYAGWRSIYWFMAGYGMLVGSLVAFGLDESLARRDTLALRPGRILRNYRQIARNDRFVAYVACIVCVYIAVFAFIASSPVVFIDHLGLPPDRMGLYLGAVMCCQLIPNYLAGRLVGRFGLQRMVKGGVITAGIAGAAMFAVVWSDNATALSILVPYGLFLAAFPFIVPPATAAALMPFPEMAGTASSLLGFLQISISAGASALTGVFADGTARPMATAFGLATLLLVLNYALAVRTRARTEVIR